MLRDLSGVFLFYCGLTRDVMKRRMRGGVPGTFVSLSLCILVVVSAVLGATDPGDGTVCFSLLSLSFSM